MTRREFTPTGLVVTAFAVAFGYAAEARASNSPIGPPGFTATLTDCIESIGVGLGPTANAEGYVPSEFTLASGGASVTPIVVRTSRCAGISFDDGFFSTPVVVVQVGAVIVPPDGTGNIDNYTIWYYTTNLLLAFHLWEVGVSAQFVPDIEYDYVPGSTTFRVAVPRPGFPTFDISGTVAPSPAPSGSFESLWWTGRGSASIALVTDVPVIDIGTADLTLTTAPDDPLGELFGVGNVTFPLTQQFNLFDSATLTVNVQASP